MKAFVLVTILLCTFYPHLYSQAPRYLVANGEYANFILDNSTQTLYGIGSGGTGIGSNTGQAGYPIPCQFPSANTKIAFAAAGLHTGSCIDVNGNVYFTGPNEDGTMGNGTAAGSANAFVQVPTDINGQPFNNVKYLRMGSSIFTGGQGYGAIIYAIKNDGTLWVWGNTQGGYAGDGTYGQVQLRPVQVTSFPAGTFITKVLVSNIVIALDSSGNVWTWAGNGNPSLLGNGSQTDYETPHTISLPAKATDIAGGGFFSYALLANQSLYGWGWYTGYMGVGSAPGSGTVGLPPPAKPMLLDTSLNLPARIAHLSTNNTTTYVILTDGTLWSWGGNECGQAGIGQELDYNLYTVNPAPYGGTPAPYAWDQDMSTAQFQVHKPVNIAPGMNNFTGLSEGVCAVWYKFAIDANGQLYSWGRNKSGILANGIMIGNYVNGTIISTYPNALDVPYVTAINPFAPGQTTIQTTSPWCLTNPTATSCSLYPVPANTPPNSLVAGVKNGSENVSGTTVTLDGTASTDNVHISYYVWTQVSGPNTPIISIPSGKTVNIIGLKTGTYVFQLRVTDNGWMSDSTKYTLNVNTGGPQPVDSAGPAQTITLPTSSVTLTGTASEAGGSIVSTKWSQLSGPGTATFGNTSALSTTASGLIQGIYTFELTATDANGVTVQSTVKITVKPAPGPPVANAGANQTITLPTSTATLTGSGSETNGTIVSFSWTQVSGPSSAVIGSAAQATTSVSGLVQGVYRFQLMVTDAVGVTATATVQVTVNAAIVPGPPVVNAGADQTITLPVNITTLTATASETNGTIVSYQWTQLSGPSTATIAAAGQASTGLSGLVQGVYTFQILVKDNSGVTATDIVKVTVNAATVLPGTPVVNAGANQTLTLPVNSATLTATASETNGTIVSYQWTQLSGPSTAAIGTAGQATTGVSGLVQGVYTFQILVTDNSGVTATDVVKVTVNAAVPLPGPPSANAGPDQILTLPVNNTTLTGSGSEVNGTIVTYQWTQVSGPSTPVFGSADQATTAVSGLVQGVYVFQLTVTDNSGVKATDVVKVTVNPVPPAHVPPVAIAGPDQTVTLPFAFVSLDGSASYDTDGSIVSYDWVQLSGMGGVTITNSSSATPDIYGLQPGTYVFQLTVTDNTGASASAQVTITVLAGQATVLLIANAGADTTIGYPASTAVLNGSGSTVTGSTIVGYSWTETSGAPGAVIGDPASAVTSISQLEPGNYIFKLTVTDSLGGTDTSSVDVRVVSTLRSSQSQNLGIYPNPFMGTTVTVTGSNSWTGPVRVQLDDLRGKSIMAYEFDKESAEFTQVIPMPSGLMNGVYLLSVYFNGQSGRPFTYRIVKQ